jgi:hypothetical protein
MVVVRSGREDESTRSVDLGENDRCWCDWVIGDWRVELDYERAVVVTDAGHLLRHGRAAEETLEFAE